MHNSSILLSLFSKCWKISKWTLSSSTSFLQFTYQSPCSCLHVQLALLLLDFQLQVLANCDFLCCISSDCITAVDAWFVPTVWAPWKVHSGSFYNMEVFKWGSTRWVHHRNRVKMLHAALQFIYLHYLPTLIINEFGQITPSKRVKTLHGTEPWLVWCGGLRVENKIAFVMQEIREVFGPCLDQLKSQRCLTHLQLCSGLLALDFLFNLQKHAAAVDCPWYLIREHPLYVNSTTCILYQQKLSTHSMCAQWQQSILGISLSLFSTLWKSQSEPSPAPPPSSCPLFRNCLQVQLALLLPDSAAGGGKLGYFVLLDSDSGCLSWSPSDVWPVCGGLSEIFHTRTFGSVLASSPWLWFSTSLQLLDLKHVLGFYLQRALWATVPSSLLSPISSLRFCQQHLLPWTVVDTSRNSSACREVESQLVSSPAGLQKVCFWRIPWWICWTS